MRFGRTASRSFAVLTFLLAAVAAPLVVAQSAPWNAPSFSVEPAVILSAAQEVKADRYAPVTVLEDSWHITLDDQHRMTNVMHRVFRVEVNEAVQNWSEVSAIYSPWRQKRPEIRARVISKDGSVHILDPKVLTDAPARDERPDVYEDNRVYSGPLPAVAAGSIVEQEIILEDTAPRFESGILQRTYFGLQAYPVLHSLLTLDAPESLPLRYAVQLLPNLHVTKEKRNGRLVLTFEHGPMAAMPAMEPDLPADLATWPAVEFSTGVSWNSIASAYEKAIESAIRPDDAAKLVADAKGLTGDELLLHLVNTLHNKIRYTGLEFGASGLIPHPASETIGRGYGDCKDKAVVLVSMLRAAGVDAKLALLQTRNDNDVSPELAGLGEFDHAIVYLPGRDLFIDATAEFAGPGELPWMDQGRQALVVDSSTQALKRIPISKPEDNLLVEDRAIYLAEFGPARIVEISHPRGLISQQYRSSYGQSETKESREELTDYVKNAYLAEGLSGFSHTNGKDLLTPFMMTVEVAKGKRGFTALEEAVAAIRPAAIVGMLPQFMLADEAEETPDAKSETAAEEQPAVKRPRQNDAEIQPFVTEWHYKIVPPPGFNPPVVPADREVKLGPTVLTQKYKVEADHSISVVWRYDTLKARFTPAEIKALREDVTRFRNSDPVLLNMRQTGAALLAAGKSREALASFDELVKLHPNEALHHLQLANALLGAGFGEQARTEARKAVALDPKSAQAQQSLAWILQHDAIGRRFGKGFDLEGAIAAYTKSKELDPKDWITRADFAILLEHNAYGVRYAAGSKLDRAITEYQELKKLDKDKGAQYDDNMLYSMFYAKRWKDIADLVATLPTNTTRQSIQIASIAQKDSATAAIAEARHIVSGEAARSNALIGAANLLLAVRNYKAAADMLNEAAPGQENASAIRARAQSMASIRKYEEALAPEGDPRRLVQQYFAFLLDPGVKIENIYNITEADESDRAVELEKIGRSAKILRSTFERAGLTMINANDALASNLQMSTEGNEADGYRVRVQGFGAKPQTALIARRPRGLRIVGFGGEVNLVGEEVLRRIALGDLKNAKQWLDWAREESPLQGGEDPLAGPVFPRMWTRGDLADAEKMKIAAIALLVDTNYIKAHFETLKAEREKASAVDQPKFDLALVHASAKLKDWKLLSESAGRLLAANPTSEFAFNSFTRAALGLRDWAAWEKAISDRDARLANDPETIRSAAHLEASRGDFMASRAAMRKLIDSGRAEMNDLNGYTWTALFIDKVSDDDITLLHRAIGANPNSRFAEIHTIACLYADVGKTKEARELLLRAMELGGLDKPDSEVWFGFGRIAEQYGLNDSALAAYSHVTVGAEFGADDNLDSTYQLMLHRIKKMKDAPPGTQPAFGGK